MVIGQEKTSLHKLDGCDIAPHRSALEYYKAPSYFGPDQKDLSAAKAPQVQHGMGPLINMQKSVFLPLWDNYELYGRKILHIESFSAMNLKT